MHQIVLVGGYKRHGKDHFFNNLLSKKGLVDYSYVSGLDKISLDLIHKRLAFADYLKEEYSRRINVPVEEIEKHKEAHRSFLIKLALELRSMDKYIFTKIISDKIEDEIKNANGEKKSFVITDFRQPDEYGYLINKYRGVCKIITVRIMCENGEIPPHELGLERDLDDFVFDVNLRWVKK
jgi:hypothetical protein